MEKMNESPGRIPLLSVVVTARNDNHGGHLLRRLQAFLDGLHQQSERFQILTELILVEWNPPAEVQKLTSVLKWPKSSAWFDAKVIEVPYELHRQYKHADTLPLYQMIAKNVGVRRARGEYILATNIDIIFEDEMFDFFAQGRLERGKIYRANRYDVDENIPEGAPIEEMLEFCRNNLIRLNTWKGSLHLQLDQYLQHYADDAELHPEEYKDPVLHTNACGDFQLMHRDHWFALRGYAEFDLFSFHLDSLFQYSAYYCGIQEVKLGEPFRIYHIEHPSSGWKPEQDKDPRHDAALKANKLDRLTSEQLSDLRDKMAQSQSACIFNGAAWGLSEFNLPTAQMTALEELRVDPPVPLAYQIEKLTASQLV